VKSGGRCLRWRHGQQATQATQTRKAERQELARLRQVRGVQVDHHVVHSPLRDGPQDGAEEGRQDELHGRRSPPSVERYVAGEGERQRQRQYAGSEKRTA